MALAGEYGGGLRIIFDLFSKAKKTRGCFSQKRTKKRQWVSLNLPPIKSILDEKADKFIKVFCFFFSKKKRFFQEDVLSWKKELTTFMSLFLPVSAAMEKIRNFKLTHYPKNLLIYAGRG
jgi:hypothetical protein